MKKRNFSQFKNNELDDFKILRKTKTNFKLSDETKTNKKNNQSKHIEDIFSKKTKILINSNFILGNKSLPIFQKRKEIISSINENQVSIISGNTGCGKSTQLPLFLFQEALDNKNNKFKVLCTQPRRLACINIARRVQEEISMTLKENSIHSHDLNS